MRHGIGLIRCQIGCVASLRCGEERPQLLPFGSIERSLVVLGVVSGVGVEVGVGQNGFGRLGPDRVVVIGELVKEPPIAMSAEPRPLCRTCLAE